MKNYAFVIGVLTFSILLFAACTKDKTEDPSVVLAQPIFTFATLIENDTIQTGELVNIVGTITYEDKMHGYTVKIRNKTTASDVFTIDYQTHTSSYNVSETWTNNVADTSEIEISIAAAIEHDGTSVTKTYRLVCLP